MLAKLTKYELKSTVNTFLLIYGAVLVLAVINRIFYSFDFVTASVISTSAGTGGVENAHNYALIAGGIFTGIFTTLYVLTTVAMFVAVIISVITRFYKNMFGSEGYLMHTLPVKPWEHIVSKMLASSVWMLGSVIMTGVSIAVLLSQPEAFRGIAYIGGEFIGFVQRSTISWTPVAVNTAIMFLMAIIGWQLPIYASICIGQLWGKHRVLGAFIAYFISNIATQIVTSLAVVAPTVSFTRMATETQAAYYDPEMFIKSAFNYYNTVMLISIIITLAFMAAYFIISNYIIKNKLDLE